MSHEEFRPQVARVWGQLIDIIMIYTDIDFEYRSQLSTTFNLTVNKPIILTHARRRNKYWKAYPYIDLLQSTVKISCISWDSSTSVHHWVMAVKPLKNILLHQTKHSFIEYSPESVGKRRLKAT